MNLNQLKRIRQVFAVLTVILLIVVAILGVRDYHSWKQSATDYGQTQINQSTGMDSSTSVLSETTAGKGIIDDKNTMEREEDEKGSTDDKTTDNPETANSNDTESGENANGDNVKINQNSSDSDPASKSDDGTLSSNSDATKDDAQSNKESDTENAFSFSFVTLIFLFFGATCAVITVGSSVIICRLCESTRKPENSGDVTEIKQMAVTVSAKPSTTKGENAETQQQSISYAQFNRIGKRQRQEDCCGVLPMENELLAIVADGMGGLKNGERVSELVVRSMMELGQRQRGNSENDILLPMLYSTNETINRTLGADIYKSGSTMLAVWIQDRGKRFQWAAVGDSRIYLFRGGSLIQLNQEHNNGQELLYMAIKGQITFEEARNNPKKSELTSFIGMGKLKYVDHSIRPVDLQIGDRILLMSDGVFNAVTDQQIAQTLRQNIDVTIVADQLVQLVEKFNNPKQDNFTAVILGF